MPDDPLVTLREHAGNLTARVDQLQARLELTEKTVILVAFACLAMAVGGLLRTRDAS